MMSIPRRGGRALCLWLAAVVFAPAAAPGDDSADDPLAAILAPQLRSSVELLLETHQNGRKYIDRDFPMPADEFAAFRKDIVSRFEESLGLSDWAVRAPSGKQSPISDRFHDRLLKTIVHHGITMEVHVVEIHETGDRVPVVICLPAGTARVPGICVFSGHTRNGLRDLVLDLNSYQRGLAVRLARAGFAAIAVEKIDTGYLSRDGSTGVDENEIATFRLGWGRITRAHQLMACLAASEMLALHPRVDETRIGAAGVSLGGWLSAQTALLSDRIAAVADFGRKTVSVPPGTAPDEFRGVADLCHILPGMLSVCDRNLLTLACCPTPMLAGHGEQDSGSQQQSPTRFEALFMKQYEQLGYGDRYAYHIHKGGDTMPDRVVIEYFTRQFAGSKDPATP